MHNSKIFYTRTSTSTIIYSYLIRAGASVLIARANNVYIIHYSHTGGLFPHSKADCSGGLVYGDSVHNPTKQNAVPILFVGKVGIAPTYSVLFPIRIAIHSLSLLHQKPLETIPVATPEAIVTIHHYTTHHRTQIHSSIRARFFHRLNPMRTLFAIMHPPNSILFYYSD